MNDMDIQMTESMLEVEVECNIERDLNVAMLTKTLGGTEPPQHMLEQRGQSQISVRFGFDKLRQRMEYTIRRHRSEEPYKEQEISLYEEELDAVMELLLKIEDYGYVKEVTKRAGECQSKSSQKEAKE